MKLITIEYGHYIDGYGFARATRAHNNRKFHLINLNAFSTTALCGKGTYGSHGDVTGKLCAECADAAGINNASDLNLDKDTNDWWKAQNNAQ